MEKYDDDKLVGMSTEDLNILKCNEQAYLDSGEILLTNYLKIPFKDNKKVEQILSTINIHKQNIKKINEYLSRDKIYDWTSGLTSYAMGSSMGMGYCQSPINDIWIKQSFITITYYDDQENACEVADDVFKSELNNYYLIRRNGLRIPLNLVIEIEKGSKLYDWYEKMSKNFIREKKINRINDDE
jgi:hypothetical protein